MAKYRLLAAVTIIASFMGGTAFAASTIGTNMSTTGTLTVTSDSATAVQFQDAAGTTTVFIVDASNTRAGVNAGGAVDTTFEVGGTASISGMVSLYGHASTSGNFEMTSSSALFGANAGGTIDTMLEIGGTASISGFSKFGSHASVAGNFELTSSSALLGVIPGGTIDTSFEVGGTASISGIITLGGTGSTGGQFRPGANSATAFRFQNAAGTTDVLSIDTSNTRVGVNAGGTLNTTFEVGGTASITSVFALTNFVVGKNTASSSTAYLGEFSTTGTTSLLLHGTSSNKGTCLQMKNTAGTIVYLRVEDTTLTINNVTCHP
ncbi:MAG: hypothetical protein UU67_C0001G0032 [Candidatus Daviesbacteria bacterium GW2011_GWB1_41_5]|uniref:Uncharacterized protein n=1 Tax=Candidatus Daviesbacteria bacterium GW2011_GWB1_41_5 TaxID=1618429 RepID=A0A0G0YXL4_9BACT|nr:MAG: hypothetical protein UU67_C0001G0032 [Candidatus Daviesbacteria bacterium GW2011_GWB1_41_5]